MNQFELNKFPTVVDFTKKYLKTDDPDYIVLYNPTYSRIDFFSKNDKTGRGVLITFEPGYPASKIMNKWYKKN